MHIRSFRRSAVFLVLAVSAVLTASGCAADPQPSVSSSASSSAPAGSLGS